MSNLPSATDRIARYSHGFDRRSAKVLLGGYSSEVPPLPIPNREVKLTHADGTAYLGGRVGSRLFKGRSFDLPFLFLFVRGIRQTAESLFYFVNGR